MHFSLMWNYSYMDRCVHEISMQVRLKYKESSPKFYRDSPNIRLVTWTCWIGSYQLILCRFYQNWCRLSADLIQAVPYLMPAAISWSDGGSTWTGASSNQLIWWRMYLNWCQTSSADLMQILPTWTGASSYPLILCRFYLNRCRISSADLMQILPTWTGASS